MVGHNVSFDRAHIREQYLVQVRVLGPTASCPCPWPLCPTALSPGPACYRAQVVTGHVALLSVWPVQAQRGPVEALGHAAWASMLAPP